MEIGKKILGDIDIVDFVGCGGEGLVAKGTVRATKQPVAVKEQNEGASKVARARFQRVDRVRIDHRAVVNAIRVGEEGGRLYLVTPFIEGRTLDKLIDDKGGKLELPEAIRLIRRLAEAVAAVHAAGVTHRDLKPDNIVVDKHGELHVLDLGICSVKNEGTLADESVFLGTPQWSSPEQFQMLGCGDHRQDLYAIGAIFYFMVTGRPPAPNAPMQETAIYVCTQALPAPRDLDPAIPEHVSRACMRMLEKRPENRFQSAETFIDALDGTPTPQANEHCTSCGAKAARHARFCAACAAELSADQGRTVFCIACGGAIDAKSNEHGCGRSFTGAQHRLTFVVGPLAGKTYFLPEGIYMVGRGELGNRDHCISRRQCYIASVNGSVFIEHAGGANPTLVDDNPAKSPTLLISGQRVVVAGNVATYTHT